MASQSRRSRGGDVDQIHGITDDDLKYKYSALVKLLVFFVEMLIPAKNTSKTSKISKIDTKKP